MVKCIAHPTLLLSSVLQRHVLNQMFGVTRFLLFQALWSMWSIADSSSGRSGCFFLRAESSLIAVQCYQGYSYTDTSKFVSLVGACRQFSALHSVEISN